MHKRLLLITILVFVATTVAFCGDNKSHGRSKFDRKPVVFIVTSFGEIDRVFEAWNRGLGKQYDIVSDAPLVDNLDELKNAKVGAHAWTSPSVSNIQMQASKAPKTIEWVFYDFEHWEYTPQNEQSDVVSASRDLKKLCTKRKWKTCFVPMYKDGLPLAAKLAPYYDAYIVQCQKFQSDMKRKQTIVYLREIEKAIHKQNPKCLVGCQLGSLDKYGNGEPFSGVKAALSLYSETKDFLDVYSIWWAPEADRMLALLKGMEEIHRTDKSNKPDSGDGK
jgi:hypothetical protein